MKQMKKKRGIRSIILLLIAVVMYFVMTGCVLDDNNEQSVINNSESSRSPEISEYLNNTTEIEVTDYSESMESTKCPSETTESPEMTAQLHTHTFGSWNIIKASTCLESGTKECICSCGEKMVEEISPKGHAYTDGKCSECGKIELIASKNLDFVLNDDGKSYSVAGIGSCSDANIIIPEHYNGLIVTGINQLAFMNCNTIECVTIPYNITSIGAAAFAGSSVTSIVVDNENSVYHSVGNCIVEKSTKTLIATCKSSIIPDDGSVINIGMGAFAFSNFASIVIPDGVTGIDADAFFSCENLKSIIIPDSVKTIGEAAFNECSSLESVTLPNSLETIEGYMFAKCTKLQSIIIPNSVETIGVCAFGYCSSLTSIVLPDGITKICSIAFIECSSLTSVNIPYGVISIETNAFKLCENLNAVYITDIAKWCNISFENESSNPLAYAHNLYLNGELVTDLIIPENVERIGNYAFAGCSNLNTITISNSVIGIGNHALKGCSNLYSISIPDSVTYIGSFAFQDCAGITSITIPSSVERIGIDPVYGCINLLDVYYTGTKEEWLAIRKLESTLFNTATIHYYASPDGEPHVHSLSNGICTVCSKTVSEGLEFSLNADKQSYSVSGIGSCQDTDIVIPAIFNDLPVTKIGERAFQLCKNIEFISIPAGVTEIGLRAFHGCYGLRSVTIPQGLTIIGERAFWNCPNLGSIVIPDSVSNIGKFAFLQCSNLKSINIPDGIINIAYGTFSDCSALSVINLPNSITSIEQLAFNGCSSLKSITIPNSVTSIGDWALGDCSSLESIKVDSGNIVYYCVENCLIEIATKTLVAGCKTSIIPVDGSVTVIGAYAFQGCTDLSNLIIPDSVKEIGGLAFDSCVNLKSITIPKSVKSIGNNAFASCSSLTDVYFSGTKTEWKKISISHTNDPLTNATIHYNSK